MKILVTGAAGLLGHELCEQLMDQGHHVVAVDDGSRGKKIPRFCEFYPVDLRGDLELDTDFERIYHFAARNGTHHFYEHSTALIENNISTDIAVFQHARRCEKLQSLIYASSSEVVVGQAPPQQESQDVLVRDIHNPRWSYRLSKMLSENYLANSGLPAVILRYFNVYGDNSLPGHFVYDVQQKIKQGRFELIGADEVRCYCHVTDAVRATLAVSHLSGEVINIGNDEPLTSRQAADIIAQVMGHGSVEWQELPGRLGSTTKRVPDLTKLKRYVLDYQPRCFRDGISEIINERL
jgi:nucleoside-diphosphate-sugar epimerase